MKNQKNQLAELLMLALTIQEKEIATVFYDFSGHTTGFEVRLFVPKWERSADPTYTISGYLHLSPEKLPEAIDVLKAVVENGIEAIPGYLEILAKQRAEKVALMNRLQAELLENEGDFDLIDIPDAEEIREQMADWQSLK